MDFPWADLVKIAGSLATVFGGIRWLLAVYFRQQKALDTARKTAFESQVELLKRELDDMRGEFRHDIEELIFQVESLTKAYHDSKISAEKVFIALGEFVMEVKEKFKKYDANLGKVEVKEAPTPASPFGSVKVKSE